MRKNGRLSKAECSALKRFAEGPVARPHGIAGTIISNLLHDKWIIRAERAFDNGPERYVNTPAGDAALAADDAAENSN
jgi:hypothetical protein